MTSTVSKQFMEIVCGKRILFFELGKRIVKFSDIKIAGYGFANTSLSEIKWGSFLEETK